MYEILQELPKCDTETQRKQILLLKKWHQYTCYIQSYQETPMYKKYIICKVQK